MTMLCPRKHEGLNLADVSQRVINRITDRARGKVSDVKDLEPPFLPLIRNEPDIFSPDCNVAREEIAYGRWALPQLLKRLNSDNQERCLMAINSLARLIHDPEKLYEAVELRIIDRIYDLLKTKKVIIKEAALIVLGIACNHYVGSDATIAAEAKSRWDSENLFESFKDEPTCDDEINSPITYVNPVDVGRLAIILSDEYPSVRYKAANVVNNISKSWHGPVGLHENNFIPVLLERAEFENIDEIKEIAELESAAGCICFITITTPSKLKAAEPELIDRLVFLASYKHSLKLQLNAVKALTNISEAPNGRSILLSNYFTQIKSIPGDHDECLNRSLQTLLQVIAWKP
ncbi:radial spoke head 14 homolog isoform X2 [Ischnura elegans]|uniref:radial spoke head 14 homolog isoform X2 n=1 Tax=Ischnura elegans TaxID=197161 RepID=UPI001ED87FCB|nr:radial spoke head 14 homolog isoform X2 [Ischnura elegans]